MKKNLKIQGNHLKETTFDFLVNKKLKISEAKRFLVKLVKVIKTDLIHLHVNKLPPGWDILIVFKESCIYLGYW